ncbi:BTAD domain-containing putative transcriptional regulator [Streptosporangium fragile]|uniref:BTAD domain-containing putative transcriptional regulator n=1 Tax=Streptosporangium fragile TaxID=46186 RepID=A0ABN3W9H6_9ACTN
MEFLVLGPVEARDNGVPVNLIGPRQRAVLARLLLARGAVVPTDTLIDDLYGGAPPASAVTALHSYVSNLRRVIEPDRASRTPPRMLITRSPGYLLAASNVDAIRFTELVTTAESLPPGEALACSEEALRLWRGVPYGEFADEPWAAVEVGRLSELRLSAVERRAQALLDFGRPQIVITDLKAESVAHPLRERLWCLLALALYRTGRQADALAVLRRAGDILTAQLGLYPGPELRRLEHDILQQSDSLALPLLTAVPVSLPAPAAPRRRIMIGRERQLAELAMLPLRVDPSGVAVAAVSGGPGIGKTRLLEAFRDRCADLGCLVLWGRCHDTEAAPPLWPWLQVLRELAGVFPPPDHEALAGLLGDERHGGTTEAPPHRNQIVAQWLVSAARTRPLVIILDDLHWADPASLDLLRDIAAMLAGGPAEAVLLTLVTAFREAVFRDTAVRGGAPSTGDPDLSMDGVLGQFARYDLLRIRLTGLTVKDVQAVAAEMGTELDDSAAERLTERTGGNPFFVRESVRLLALGQGREAVPDTVADLVRRQVALLGPQATQVLTTAAVIGRYFDPGVVTEVCRTSGTGPAQVYRVLDLAAQAGLVLPRGGSMTFACDLVREILVRDIPPLRKAVIHQEVMSTLAARPSTDVAVLAHHAAEAGPAAYREAARWARSAARQASLRLAYGEAAAWWGRAVAAHGACAGDPAEYVELLLQQVRALLEAGDAPGARLVRAEAVRVADQAEAGPELVVRALTSLNAPSAWVLRDPYEVAGLRLVDRFEAALRALPETDSSERALLLGGLAQELHDGHDDPRRRSLSAEAVAMARRLGDPHLLMWTLNARRLSVPQATHLPELVEVATEMHELALRTRMPEFELLAQMMHTHNRLEMFDLAGADQAATRCDVLLERLRLPWPRFQHTMWRANRLALAGRFDDAEILYGAAARQAERLGVRHAGGIVATGRLMSRYQRGRIADAGPLIDLAAGIHPGLGHDARVLELCAQGRVSEARALAGKGWPPPPADWSWLTMTCLQGAAQAAVGDMPSCRTTYERLLPYAGRISGGSAMACAGPVDGFLALLASSMGNPESVSWHLASLKRLAPQNGFGDSTRPPAGDCGEGLKAS